MKTREMNAKRFAAKPLRQPTYDFQSVPKCASNLQGSCIWEISDRSHFVDCMAEMVLLCKEAVRRSGSKRSIRNKNYAKPLSLEYMADRIDVDDPTFGFVVRHQHMLQGFCTVTTFTNWQKTFRWDSMHESAFSYDDDVVAQQMACGTRRVDQDGTLAEALQATVKCGDPWNEGIVWPRIAEISLLGGLGCGKTLLSLVIEKLEHMNATGTRNYDYVVLQATDNSIPFYESMGFVRVGCITEDLDFEKKRQASSGTDSEQEKKQEVQETPPPPAEVVSSPVMTHVTQKAGEVPADVAKRYGCDVWDVIFLNQYVFPDIMPRSRLIKGTCLFVPACQEAKRNATSHASRRRSRRLHWEEEEEQDGGVPQWYVANENDTPRMISKMFDLDTKSLVLGNRERLPELQSSSRLKEGTRIKVSHFHIHDDVHVPYCHWTFPDDTLETSEPSYMMALKLNRKKSKKGSIRPVENSLAVPIQTKYEPPPQVATTNESAAVTRSVAHKTPPAVKEPVRPKRPLSSYMLFCRDHRQYLDGMDGKPGSELTKALSQMWQEADEASKAKYQALHEKERAAYKRAKAKHDVELAAYRKAHPCDAGGEEPKTLFNKVVKLVNYGSSEYPYYYVLTYIPDLQWCHLAPMQPVGLWGPDKPRAEGRPIWMLVDESMGKELDVSSSHCQVVKARSMKRTVDADQEQWDILESSTQIVSSVLAPVPVKQGRGRPRKIKPESNVPNRSESVVKRKRGRPPKVKPESELTMPNGNEPVMKRQRGRPPKVKPESELTTSSTSDPVVKRKRGRPPKAKAATNVSSAAIVPPVEPRKRGRPPKVAQKLSVQAMKKLLPPSKKKWGRTPPKSFKPRVDGVIESPSKRNGVQSLEDQQIKSPPRKRARKQQDDMTAVPCTPTKSEPKPPPRAKGPFVVGDVVEVQSRTWPGINKLGGVGRVTKVQNLDNGIKLYDIKYVLGGREKNVDSQFVLGMELKSTETPSNGSTPTTRTSPRKRRNGLVSQESPKSDTKKESRLSAEPPVESPNKHEAASDATLPKDDESPNKKDGKAPGGNMEEQVTASPQKNDAGGTRRRITPPRQAAPTCFFAPRATKDRGEKNSGDVTLVENHKDAATQEESCDFVEEEPVRRPKAKRLAPIFLKSSGRGNNKRLVDKKERKSVTGRSRPVRNAAPIFGEGSEPTIPLLLGGGRGVRRATRASA